MIYVLWTKEYEKKDVYHILKLFNPSEEIAFVDCITFIDDKSFMIEFEIHESPLNYEVSVRIIKKGKCILSETVAMDDLEFFDDSVLSKKKVTLKHALFKLLSSYYGFHPGYGILTGTRPVKLVRTLSENGLSNSMIDQTLQQTFCLNKEKVDTLLSVYAVERKMIEKNPRYVNLYIGIQFCPSICSYCSFGSYLYKNDEALDQYIDILTEEMKNISNIIRELALKVKTIYVGGGTPSLLNPKQLNRFLSNTHNLFSSNFSGEFSFEAGRPDTISEEKLSLLKDYGVNRISINPQTMNSDTLKRVGRNHTPADFYKAFESARKIGFRSINMDFINGLPGETLKDAELNMACVDRVKPENVTVHSLSIKRGSDFHKKNYVNTTNSINTEIMETFYKKHLQTIGMHIYYLYRQKNITNNSDNCGYAFFGYESLYNINIIEEIQTVIAMGAGATSKIVDGNNIIRIGNNKDLKTYASKLSSNTEQIKKMLSRILTD
jgi:coproporphyrinogen dehydrogenase HemZ